MAKKFTVTLKSGSSAGDPWVIIKADTASELQAALDDIVYLDVATRIYRAAHKLKTVINHD